MGEDKFRHLVEEHKEETEASIRQEIEKLKNQIVDEHLEKNEAHFKDVHVYEGDPELEILHMADTLKADMVVMGTHARKLTPYPFMGSVAKRVLRGIRVPVLMVPPVAS
jgi:nucleotide-binding universal stress UspA family protein